MGNRVIDYYSRFDEAGRLDGEANVERLRSQEIISRHLGEGPLSVLDIGGAAGAYSFWLASMGHEVDLVDLTPRHIEQARERERRSGVALRSARVADALELPCDDSCYDLVLLMGPLYHLQERRARIGALREAARAARPGAPVFVAAISRYASMIDGFKHDLALDDAFYPIMMADIECGKHVNESGNPLYFTDAFFHQPDELRAEMAEAGLGCRKLFAVEGFSNCVPDLGSRMGDPRYRERLMEALRRTEEEPSILGSSSHFLALGCR